MPELADQFAHDSFIKAQKGNAPSVKFSQYAGKRSRFELHHITRIVDGGAVYDVDNLRVNTPKNHIELHEGE